MKGRRGNCLNVVARMMLLVSEGCQDSNILVERLDGFTLLGAGDGW